MRRRVFRRSAAVAAVLAGATGLAANAFLILYFGLARPWERGHSGAFEWLGPANDIVGSMSMAALIPVIGYVRWQTPGDRLLAVLSAGGVVAAGAMAVAGPMLVAGSITLETQFVVAGIGVPVIFCWLWRASRAAGHRRVLPRRTARVGEVIAVLALAGTAVAFTAMLLPTASAGQVVVLGVAALAGLPAYLAFPVWQLMAGRAWWRDPARREPPARTLDTRVHGSNP